MFGSVRYGIVGWAVTSGAGPLHLALAGRHVVADGPAVPGGRVGPAEAGSDPDHRPSSAVHRTIRGLSRDPGRPRPILIGRGS
jgi:hypothetical protein